MLKRVFSFGVGFAVGKIFPAVGLIAFLALPFMILQKAVEHWKVTLVIVGLFVASYVYDGSKPDYVPGQAAPEAGFSDRSLRAAEQRVRDQITRDMRITERYTANGAYYTVYSTPTLRNTTEATLTVRSVHCRGATVRNNYRSDPWLRLDGAVVRPGESLTTGSLMHSNAPDPITTQCWFVYDILLP